MDALVRRNTAIGSRVTVVHWLQLLSFSAIALFAFGTAIASWIGGGQIVVALALGAGGLFMAGCALSLFNWMNGLRRSAA
jgi:hypothetical protein